MHLLSPPHPVLELFEQVLSHRQSQPRLAAPSGPAQRDQASGAAQQPPDLADLLLAPYEAGQLQRQVVGRALRGTRGYPRHDALPLAVSRPIFPTTGASCQTHRARKSTTRGDIVKDTVLAGIDHA